MKMKNLFLASAIAVLFAGCDTIAPPAIYSSKALGELTTDLKKISETYKIEKVRISEKEELSNEFGLGQVQMYDSEGQKFDQVLYYNFNIPHNDPRPATGHSSNKKEIQPVNVDDIIALQDKMEGYVENAKTQIAEKFEGKYQFESVGDIEFTADKEGKLQVKFEINVTEKGKADRREGGRMVTDYYGLEFTVDKDGNVVYVED